MAADIRSNCCTRRRARSGPDFPIVSGFIKAIVIALACAAVIVAVLYFDTFDQQAALQKVQQEEETLKNLVFVDSLPWFCGYFIICLLLLLLFFAASLKQKR